MRILLAFLFVFVCGTVLTIIARKLAPRAGLMSAPRDDRWHQKPTPLLGGVAIYLSFALGSLVFAGNLANAYPIMAAGTMLFLTGLIDDRVHIKPYTKLVVQLIAASLTVYFGFHLPWVEYQWINDLLTIFWLVGITNAINLLDNMDGLAGGVTVIACAFLTITFLLNGQVLEAQLPAMLGAATLGFLIFNFNPASIFMGDSGSMFLGFMLSSIALLSGTGRVRNLTSVLLSPLLILMIPIFDTCMVTVTRKLSGRKVSQGGRDHSSHRLVALGVPERRAVLLLYVFAAVSGILALMVRLVETPWALTIVPAFALVVLFLGLYLGKVRIYEEGEQPAGLRIINAIAGFSYKRRIFEVLLDVVLVTLAYYGAYVIRWDGHLPSEQLSIFMRTLPLVIIVEMTVLLVGGVYRGLWRYAGIKDLIVIARSALAGAALSMLVVFLVYSFSGPSRGVFLVNGLLILVIASASRLSFRLLREMIEPNGEHHPDAQPILIYGAGDGGELLIKELSKNPDYRYVPIGFVDDDQRKAGKLMHGYRIFASSQVPDLIRTHGITEILVSSVKVPETRLEDLRGFGVSLKKMSIRLE